MPKKIVVKSSVVCAILAIVFVILYANKQLEKDTKTFIEKITIADYKADIVYKDYVVEWNGLNRNLVFNDISIKTKVNNNEVKIDKLSLSVNAFWYVFLKSQEYLYGILSIPHKKTHIDITIANATAKDLRISNLSAIAAIDFTKKKVNFELKNKVDILSKINLRLKKNFILNWSQQDNNYTINIPKIYFDTDTSEVASQIITNINKNNSTTVELYGLGKGIAIHKIIHAFADVLTPAVHTWLESSVKTGTIVKIIYKNNNDLQIYFSDGTLKYAENWPKITNHTGSIILQDRKLSIKTTSAKILEENISTLTASIDTSTNENLNMNIRGGVTTTTDKMVDFLANTPVSKSDMYKLLQHYPEGRISLDLSLDVPITNWNNTITNVCGEIELHNIKLKQTHDLLPVEDIAGKINFDENNVFARNIKAVVCDMPAEINICKSLKNTDGTVDISSSINSVYLNKLFNITENSFSGASKAKVKISFYDNIMQPKIKIKSDLSGIAFNLPHPLYKTVDDKWPLEVELKYENYLNEVDLLLADQLKAKLLFTTQQLKKGYINFGVNAKAELPESELLYIGGTIPKLDLLPWTSIMRMPNSKLKVPVEMSLNTTTLKVRNIKFRNIWLQHAANADSIDIDSSRINGSIRLSETDEHISFDLNRLELTEDMLFHASNDTSVSSSLMPIYFKCDNLYVYRKYVGDLSFNLIPVESGYKLTNISLQHPIWHVDALGEIQNVTNLSGNIFTSNMGEMLNAFRLPSSIYKGQGNISFSLNWPGRLTQMSLANSTGVIDLDLHKGQILSLDPGMGRLVGLLSLQNFSRRLQLDFNDFIAEDYYFDSIKGEFNVSLGKLNTSNLLILSPAAKVELKGNSVITNKTLDLDMRVESKGSATLPIAAIMAATNPAFGAGIWLFDQTFSSKLGQHKYSQYKVAGTWQKPEIKEISS